MFLHSYHWYIKLPNVSPILFLKIFFAVMTKPLNFCDSSVDPRVTIKKYVFHFRFDADFYLYHKCVGRFKFPNQAEYGFAE